MLRYDEMFQRLVFVDEGDVSNDPLDKGGKTIYGIASASFPMEFKECYDLYMSGNKEKALQRAKDFYRIKFYNSVYDNILDSSLCYMLFSFGVNAGVQRSVKILQKVLQTKYNPRIAIDGNFGPQTLSVVNSVSKESIEGQPESTLFYDYQAALEKYYRSLWNFFRFGKGWLNRIRRIFNYKQ